MQFNNRSLRYAVQLSCMFVFFLSSGTTVAQKKMNVPGTVFGQPIKNTEIADMAELISAMKLKDKWEGRLKGRIVSVCQKKGCWMQMEVAGGEPLHITFKEYSLFMPMDIVGKEVVVEGKAWKNITSVDELRHYAEDAGKSEAEINKIVDPKEEVRFEAWSVVIIDQ